MASEDIGNADPRGLEIALNARAGPGRLGSRRANWRSPRQLPISPAHQRATPFYTAFNLAMASARDPRLARSAGAPAQRAHPADERTWLWQAFTAMRTTRPGAFAGRDLSARPAAGSAISTAGRARPGIKIADKLAQLRGLDRQAIDRNEATNRPAARTDYSCSQGGAFCRMLFPCTRAVP